MHNTCGIQHYEISSLLDLCKIKDKYIAIYNEFISQLWIYAKAVRILDELEKELANKNFFNSQVVKIFEFIVAIISIIATIVTIYAICKHNKLRALVTSLALQQVKEVKVDDIENIN